MIVTNFYIYNFIRHIGSHIQYKKAIYNKQYDEKVNNSVTIFNNTFEWSQYTSKGKGSLFV